MINTRYSSVDVLLGSFLRLHHLGLLEHRLDGERAELLSVAFVELVLELYPVEPQRVQECLHQIHHHQNSNCECEVHEEAKEKLKRVNNASLPE